MSAAPSLRLLGLCPRCRARTSLLPGARLGADARPGERWTAVADDGLYVEACPTAPDVCLAATAERTAVVEAWLRAHPDAVLEDTDRAHPWWPTDVRAAWRRLVGGGDVPARSYGEAVARGRAA